MQQEIRRKKHKLYVEIVRKIIYFFNYLKCHNNER